MPRPEWLEKQEDLRLPVSTRARARRRQLHEMGGVELETKAEVRRRVRMSGAIETWRLCDGQLPRKDAGSEEWFELIP